MKILMFGRGSIASMYAWALSNAGHEVAFYVRPGGIARYGNTIMLDILDGRAALGGKPVQTGWPVRFREDLLPDHDYDLIIVSVQHYQFAEAAAFLGSRAARATVLVFNNFWVDPQQAASALPPEQLAWGFPMAGGGFDRTGVLRGAFFKSVQFGTFRPQLTNREMQVRDLFAGAGFRCVEQADFKGWLWTHFALSAGLQSQALQAPLAGHRFGNAASLSRGDPRCA